MAALSHAYTPRRPAETLLHGLVREHLRSFLSYVERAYAGPLPRYVVDAFHDYLACGDFFRGFTRCRCEACGHDVLVAFSCGRRGLCPSCGARRMCNLAAQLVDRVVPSVAVRQWVLSLPFELSALAALRPDVVTAIGRIFAEEVERLTIRAVAVAGARSGSLGQTQRFGSSLNVHVHFHHVALDVAFELDGDGVGVHEAPPPSPEALEELVTRVRDRALRWLRKRGYLDERAAEERDTTQPTPSALEGCTQLALSGGAFLARPFVAVSHAEADLERRERRFSASRDGFDVHCAVRIEADDDQGRERLLRYCARPAFSLERLSVLPDGRIAYLLKKPRKGRTHRVMTPVEFLARLAALVAPPKYPLLRYHGVLAPRSSWRRRIAPTAHRPKPARCASKPPVATPPATSVQPLASTQAPPTNASFAEGAAPPRCPPDASAMAPEPAVELQVGPMTLTIRHWGRLQDGELLATSPRIDWPRLMRRTLGFDVLACPKCAGRMRVLSVIDEPRTVKKILHHLGLPAEPPELATARGPPMHQVGFGFEVA